MYATRRLAHRLPALGLAAALAGLSVHAGGCGLVLVDYDYSDEIADPVHLDNALLAVLGDRIYVYPIGSFGGVDRPRATFGGGWSLAPIDLLQAAGAGGWILMTQVTASTASPDVAGVRLLSDDPDFDNFVAAGPLYSATRIAQLGSGRIVVANARLYSRFTLEDDGTVSGYYSVEPVRPGLFAFSADGAFEGDFTDPDGSGDPYEFSHVSDILALSDGSLAAIDLLGDPVYAGQLLHFSADGLFLGRFSEGPALLFASALCSVTAVGGGEDREILVADLERLLRYGEDGTYIGIFGEHSPLIAQAMVELPNRNVIVAAAEVNDEAVDTLHPGALLEFSPDGVFQREVPLATSAEATPRGLAVVSSIDILPPAF